MYKVGVFPGKFLPPHRGHISAIIQAATKTEKLYVVVSGNEDYMSKVCKENNLREMPLIMRAKWMAKELEGFPHIKIVTIDETHIPSYPEGTKLWSELLKKTIPEKFDVIFGGEEEYRHTYMGNFPDVEYIVYDTDRTRYPVSATKIRSNPLKYWDYILGAARPHFTKRILITGVESAGKTTLTKYLAKIYHTSWSEEYGRYYSTEHFGGNENLFEEKDFINIARRQTEIDEETLKHANKVAFFDTDVIVTGFYHDLYLKNMEYNEDDTIHNVVGISYDLIIMLGPEVKWVPDGFRFVSSYERRKELFEELKNRYSWFNSFWRIPIVEIHSDDYNERLNLVIEEVDNFLIDK